MSRFEVVGVDGLRAVYRDKFLDYVSQKFDYSSYFNPKRREDMDFAKITLYLKLLKIIQKHIGDKKFDELNLGDILNIVSDPDFLDIIGRL